MQEPHVEYAVDYRRQVPVLARQTVEQNPLPWKGRTDTAALRLIFEQALKHRKPYAILIDEAEHIAKAARGSTLLDQLDHLKSLAIMSQVVHVLVGTYDLMVFRNLSAQLSRRSPQPRRHVARSATPLRFGWHGGGFRSPEWSG